MFIHYGENYIDSDIDLAIMPSFVSPTPGMYFGYSVGPAGDFNGDGVDDLAITSRQKFYSAIDSGRVYILGWPQETAAVDENDPPLPENYNKLYQNYPNPFNEGTVIEYYLYKDSIGEVEVNIYNLLGQKVRGPIQNVYSSGRHELHWDGKDNSGNPLTSGVYFYQLKTGNESISKKMIYLK